jgi:pilus assembly protein CpaC
MMDRHDQTSTGRGGRLKALAALLPLVLAFAGFASPAAAATGSAFPLSVNVGQSLVLETPNEVSTVSIADPKVADAAVGSQRTVVVNGKSTGVTSLVVWEEGGRYTLYQVSCVDPKKKDQVLLKVKVSEVLTDKVKELGLDWAGSVSSAQHLDGTLSGGLFATKVETPVYGLPLPVGSKTDGYANWVKSTGSARFMTTLRVLEENGSARTLASPNLVAVSGDSAAFLAGGEFPVPVPRSISGEATTLTIEWKEYGIRLGFRPTVLSDGRIRLSVAPEVSAPDYTRALQLAGYTVPGLVTRRISTTVELKPGDVLVIGGVKQEETTVRIRKVPILGDIPLLKTFFRHKATSKISRDLLIMVSPEMITELAKKDPFLPTDRPEEVK